MTLRVTAAAVALVIAFGCGRNDAPSAAQANDGAATAAADGSGSVTGKLASSLAPPSTVLVLEPQGAADLPVTSEPAVMDQAGYEFLPAFLLAQAGQLVQFRNSEDILHNVRVTEASSQTPVFNVATLAFGKYEHKFDPGYYNVTCDIHPTMRASILVSASPYTTTTGADGGFSLDNVRAGQYNLIIYAGAAPVMRLIEVKSGRTELGEIR